MSPPFAAAAVVLAAVGLLAGLLPARRRSGHRAQNALAHPLRDIEAVPGNRTDVPDHLRPRDRPGHEAPAGLLDVCVSFAFHLPDKCVIPEVPANQESAKEQSRFEESDARQRFGTEGSVVRIHSPRPILIRGLRPRTPYTLTRGGPSLPAPFAWLTRSRSFAH